LYSQYTDAISSRSLEFKVAGSIAQGRPAPWFLSEVAYYSCLKVFCNTFSSITNEKSYPYMKDKNLLGAIDKV
jgi:hypothetical protein